MDWFASTSEGAKSGFKFVFSPHRQGTAGLVRYFIIGAKHIYW